MKNSHHRDRGKSSRPYPNCWQDPMMRALWPRTPGALLRASAALTAAAMVVCAAVVAPNTQEQTPAEIRRALLIEQATREPFIAPHDLPVLPGLPPGSRAVGASAPSEPRPDGAVLETRQPINPAQRPAFPEQTRAPAHRSRTPIEATVVARGLVRPWGLAFLPDGRALVTEKPGTMRVVTQDGQIGRPIQGIPPVLYTRFPGSERPTDAGLLDVVIDPAFSSNRRIYFSFAGFTSDGNALMVAGARLSTDASQLEDVVQLLTMPSYRNAAHYGGRLLIGPDGMLYIGASERMADGIRMTSQDPRSPMGKLLRIGTDGGIPPDNPYAQVPGADPTVYSLGLRDVQGLAIQPESGAIWVTDHGPQGGDEINIVEPGHNYGWPLAAYGTEYNGNLINRGAAQWPGTEQPVYYWDPAIAPAGATFYSGSLVPEWRGDLFVAALAGQHLTRLAIRGNKVVGEERLLQDQRQRVRDVEQGPDGALWVVTDEEDGRLIRIAPRVR